MDLELLLSTCDWGGCDEDGAAYRWWIAGQQFLLVCERHKRPESVTVQNRATPD